MPRNMDQFGSEDMSLPELKLAQPTGEKPEGCNPGNFFVSISDDIYEDGLNIIIADIKKSRTYWGRTELDNEPPECSSEDMISGQLGPCAECQFRCDSPWLIDATARRMMCLMHYTLMVINYDTKMPMVLRASGISTASVKEIFTLLRINKQLHGEYERAIIKLVSEKKKTAQGEAYQMRFKLISIVQDANEAAELRQLAAQLLGADLTLIPEETAGERIAQVLADPASKTLPAPKPESAPVFTSTNVDKVVAETKPGGKQPPQSTPKQAPVNLDF